MRHKRTGGLLSLIVLALLGGSVACATQGAGPGTTASDGTGVESAWMAQYMKGPGYKPEWGQPKTGGIIKYGGSHQFIGHDPNYGHTFEGPQFLPIYNSLVRFDPWIGPAGGTGAIEGDLAESWELSKDGLSLTFKLRKGVKFQDNPNLPAAIKDKVSGDEFVCEDAKASLEFAVNPPKPIQHINIRAALNHFKSATCSDGPRGHTLVVEFTDALAKTLSAFAGAGGMPNNMDKDFIDWIVKECATCLDETTSENYLWSTGTGPFIPVEYQMDVITKLRRNPTYFREGLPLVDGMDQYVMKDFTARFTALVTGQIHYFGEGSSSLLPGQVAEAQRFKDKIEVQGVLHSWGKGSYEIAMSRKPFNDVRVRKAIHLGIDREAWVAFSKTGEFEGAHDPTNWMPPGTVWALPDQELKSLPGWRQPKAQDMAEANRLLDEAGYRKDAGGLRFKTTCQAQNSQQYIDGCTFLKDQFKKNMGIELVIDACEGVVCTEKGEKSVNDINYGSAAYTNFGDPDDWYIRQLVPEFQSRAVKATGMDKAAPELAKELERMVRAQSKELDQAKRVKLVHEIERKLATEAYFYLAFPWTTIFPAWSRDLKGWTMYSFPSQSKDAQWERAWLVK